MPVAAAADLLSPFLTELRSVGVEAWQWSGLAVAAGAALLLAWLLVVSGRVAFRLLALRRRLSWDEQLASRAVGPARLLLATGIFAVLHRAVHLAPPAQDVVHHLLRILVAIAIAWAALRGTASIADAIAERVGEGEGPEGRARMTRVMVLRRVMAFVIIVVATGTVLVQFSPFRALGTSLLASASVVGVVFGLAAQRSLASLFAGIQISLTQPIRVGDVVLIEGESGTVEEITLTYVVVRIWDLRRLIVPITRFLDTPFQNWTRTGTAILGSAVVYVDYQAPVDQLRTELRRFVGGRPEWDGKIATLDVTSVTERTLELTAVVSSGDSDRNGALRCAIREHLVDWLQRLEGGRYLPRGRIDSLPAAS
jgi:small-conductance mechanosensitive channel